MENTLKNEVATRVNRLGDWEFKLALTRCGANAKVAQLAEAVEEHRKPFMKDRGAVNNGSGIFLSKESWDALAKESDEAAKDLLMAGSRLAEVERLASKAEAAAEAARRARAEFDTQCQEYNALPARIDQLTARLADLNNARAEVNNAPSDFREAYKAILSGSTVDRFALVFLASTITTMHVRLQAISEVETELKTQLNKLTERQATLKRILK